MPKRLHGWVGRLFFGRDPALSATRHMPGKFRTGRRTGLDTTSSAWEGLRRIYPGRQLSRQPWLFMLQSDTGWRDRGEGALNDCAKRAISRGKERDLGRAKKDGLLCGFTVAQAEAYATEGQRRKERTGDRGKFNIAWRFCALAQVGMPVLLG